MIRVFILHTLLLLEGFLFVTTHLYDSFSWKTFYRLLRGWPLIPLVEAAVQIEYYSPPPVPRALAKCMLCTWTSILRSLLSTHIVNPRFSLLLGDLSSESNRDLGARAKPRNATKDLPCSLLQKNLNGAFFLQLLDEALDYLVLPLLQKLVLQLAFDLVKRWQLLLLAVLII